MPKLKQAHVITFHNEVDTFARKQVDALKQHINSVGSIDLIDQLPAIKTSLESFQLQIDRDKRSFEQFSAREPKSDRATHLLSVIDIKIQCIEAKLAKIRVILDSVDALLEAQDTLVASRYGTEARNTIIEKLNTFIDDDGGNYIKNNPLKSAMQSILRQLQTRPSPPRTRDPGDRRSVVMEGDPPPLSSGSTTGEKKKDRHSVFLADVPIHEESISFGGKTRVDVTLSALIQKTLANAVGPPLESEYDTLPPELGGGEQTIAPEHQDEFEELTKEIFALSPGVDLKALNALRLKFNNFIEEKGNITPRAKEILSPRNRGADTSLSEMRVAEHRAAHRKNALDNGVSSTSSASPASSQASSHNSGEGPSTAKK